VKVEGFREKKGKGRCFTVICVAGTDTCPESRIKKGAAHFLIGNFVRKIMVEGGLQVIVSMDRNFTQIHPKPNKKNKKKKKQHPGIDLGWGLLGGGQGEGRIKKSGRLRRRAASGPGKSSTVSASRGFGPR